MLLAILLLGAGLGIGLGSSEAPSEQHQGSSVASIHPASVSTALPNGETPRPGDPGWSITVYEPAVRSTGGALAQCPNPLGLESFGISQESTAEQIATTYDHDSLDLDLRSSDPSWWPDVEQMWHQGPGNGITNPYVVGSGPGLSGPSASLVPHSCGPTIGSETYSVVVGPSPDPDCVACRTTISFVDRAGQPLVYFVY